MRTLSALLGLDLCWWHGCPLPGAWAEAGFGPSEEFNQSILVCGLHAQIVAHMMDRPEFEIELWVNDGIPSLHLTRAA